jgi:hypothetical protein
MIALRRITYQWTVLQSKDHPLETVPFDEEAPEWVEKLLCNRA